MARNTEVREQQGILSLVHTIVYEHTAFGTTRTALFELSLPDKRAISPILNGISHLNDYYSDIHH